MSLLSVKFSRRLLYFLGENWKFSLGVLSVMVNSLYFVIRYSMFGSLIQRLVCLKVNLLPLIFIFINLKTLLNFLHTDSVIQEKNVV